MPRRLTDQEIEMAENIFREYLRERGLKYTPERRMVLREVLSTAEHFEAEQLLFTLRQAGRRVAKATIYRTLPLLVSCGIVKQIQFGDKLTRYESIFGREAHDHMVCRRCRRIVEFDSRDVDRLCTVLAARHKFHVVSHRFQITGLCWECVQATPEAERPFMLTDDSDQ